MAYASDILAEILIKLEFLMSYVYFQDVAGAASPPRCSTPVDPGQIHPLDSETVSNTLEQQQTTCCSPSLFNSWRYPGFPLLHLSVRPG